MPDLERNTRWPEEGKEFRLAWWILSLGIIGVCGFGAFEFFAVHAAWTNSDGSFRYPVPTAIVLGLIGSFFSLGSAYLILAYCRERLFIAPRSLRSVGCFRTRNVDLAAVQRVVWKPDGTVEFHDDSGKVKVSLLPYGAKNRAEIVQRLRDQMDEVVQEGWEKFEPMHVLGGSSWEGRRERGQHRFVWVQNVLPALCLGAGFVLKDWFNHPMDWKLLVPWLTAFGVGGYLVGIYRWRTNEAAYRATGEAPEPFELPTPNADHPTLLAIGVALLVLLPVGYISYSLLQKLNAGSWQRCQDAGLWALEDVRYADAERRLKAAVALAESFGEYDVRLADSLSALATIYGKQARDAEAEPLMRRALTIREKALGPDHPIVARNLNDLAWINCNEGRYAESERLSRQALAIREKALDGDDVEVGRNLNDLAWFLYREGKFAEAEEPLKQSLAIFERGGEASRLELAACLNRLAILDRALGKLAEAKPIFERALAIREARLGPAHPEVAESLGNLATVLRDQEHFAEARPLFERAVGIFEKVMGPDSPGLAWTLTNLALLESSEGRDENAEVLLGRVLSIREKTFGPDHPEVALALGELAAQDLKRGRYAESEKRASRALAILDASQGTPPTDIARILDILARLDTQAGRFTEAESRFKKALSLREQSLPSNYPKTADVLDHYAALLRKSGRVHEAEAIESRAQVIRENQPPPVK